MALAHLPISSQEVNEILHWMVNQPWKGGVLNVVKVKRTKMSSCHSGIFFAFFRHFSTLFIRIFLDFPICFMPIPLYFSRILWPFILFYSCNLNLSFWPDFTSISLHFFGILTSHLGKRDKLLILGHQTTIGDYLRGGRRVDRKSTRLNSSHLTASRMPSSACNPDPPSHNTVTVVYFSHFSDIFQHSLFAF